MLTIMSDSLKPHGLNSPWNSPGQDTGVGSCSLLQGIFPTQGSNPGLPHCRWTFFTSWATKEALFKIFYKKRQRNERSNCQHLLGHQKIKRVPEKHLFLLYWWCQSLCVHHNKLWKILKEMGIPAHVTCLLTKLYAGQETRVRTGHGATDWF